MGSEQDLNIPEIGRALARLETSLEKLTEQVNAAIGPIKVNAYQIAALGREMEELGRKVYAVEQRAGSIEARSAAISGGIAALAFVLNWLKGGH